MSEILSQNEIAQLLSAIGPGKVPFADLDYEAQAGELNGQLLNLESAIGAHIWQAAIEGVENPKEKMIGRLKEITKRLEEFKIGSAIRFGGYDWRVLDEQNGKPSEGGAVLILSEKLIADMSYHSRSDNATWADCELRAYLNGEFYDKFSEQEKARVVETSVTNNANPWHGADGGGDTTDKIFLLSVEEVVKYFGDSGQLKNPPKDTWYGISDQYDTARIAKTSLKGEPDDWWLRSPGKENCHAAYVTDKGRLEVGGEAVYIGLPFGIRPALWLKL